MRVLVVCEFSGAVRRAFRARGHEAWSNDLLPAEDGSRFHFQCDALTLDLRGWDMMICHPPCTYLTCSAEWAYKDGPYHQRLKPGTLAGADRRQARERACQFFLTLWAAPAPRICIENPVGVMSRRLHPAHQYIQPNEFGHDASKSTGLWLKNLPPLRATNYIAPRLVNGRPRWGNQTDSGQNRLPPSDQRAIDRSRTYSGVAEAMATQWGALQ